ncbi:hypothetical protein ACNHKD_08275 [Methylocystis sp. JAN1]|uniref:hypothetical protein n=1 Tax=Methylocystis sp. JAN1 TaxID=3397211 RepID=UPI003FA23CD1
MEYKTSIRQRIEAINGVKRTWFEWTSAERTDAKLLVVEVDFDTDPNSAGYSDRAIAAIGQAYEDVLQEGLQDNRPVLVSGIRIVPMH